MHPTVSALDNSTAVQSNLEPPPPCKSHHVIRINIRSDFAKPLQIPTVHVLQRCAKKRIIGIFGCIRHILPIRESNFVDYIGDAA
jgi:hypothetical protein